MQLIACDLDRTLLPNGDEQDDGSLDRFFDIVENLKDTKLAYVTGRNLKLFQEGVQKYGLHMPDFLLGSVGTEVYMREGDHMAAHPKWFTYLAQRHPHWSRDQIVDALVCDDTFFLQEDEFQNTYKICYYIRDAQKTKDRYVQTAEKFIKENDISANVIYSYDPLKQIGLLDILPTSATKQGALEFTMSELNITKDDVIFAGDSGNDLLALTAGFRSILVRNAHPDTKQQAQEIVADRGIADCLYIAHGSDKSNGNYASGVIEGLGYFGVA